MAISETSVPLMEGDARLFDDPPPTAAEQLEEIYRQRLNRGIPVFSETGEVTGFLSDVLAFAPEKLSAFAREKVFPLLSGDMEHDRKLEVFHDFVVLAQKVGAEIVFSQAAQRMAHDRFQSFIDAVSRQVAGERSVVFISSVPYFQILREAIYLRKNGFRVYLLTLLPPAREVLDCFNAHFDGVAVCGGWVSLMRAILSSLSADILHVQCWMWAYELGRLAIEHRRNGAVVCEFNDVTSVYADRPVLCSNWPVEEVDFDIAMEEFIVRHADAVITRTGPIVNGELRARYGGSGPIVDFHPWPCREFSHYGAEKLSAADGEPRLVYAGSIIPINDDHPAYLFPAHTLPLALSRLIAQGLHVHLLIDPNRPPDPANPSLAPFFSLQRRHSRFDIRAGLPPDVVARELARYDFGIILFDEMTASRLCLGPHLLPSAVGTKLFNYLEAGLPVIVNSEYETMARFLEENGLGFGVASDRLEDIPEMIRRFDYAGAVERIRRFNEERGMHWQIHRLIELYDTIGNGD
jgi:hypothetical protein